MPDNAFDEEDVAQMQNLANGLFDQINTLRADPIGYMELMEDISPIAAQEIALFPPVMDEYVWNEGLA